MSFEEIAINVTGLGKRYEIYDRPSDRLKQFILPKIARLLGKNNQRYFREFWALNDVSFQLRKGETLAIIGRNGSGKSTLLQIICGTLNPTNGTVQVHGKVAALLELGSGFNPEFTGRENVYLNASILGLSKVEIDERFQKIESFADIGEFIEQPVKTYSSGMLVRLAFAVIAHVDADILVIDEALAVGDAVFTQKCMRFIRNFQKNGALIFVSHDIAAVQNLCQSALWLKKGLIEQIGATKLIAEAYLQFTLQEIYGDEVRLSSTLSGAAKPEFSDDANNCFEGPPVIVCDIATLDVENNLDAAKGWRTGGAEILAVKLTKLSDGKGTMFVGGERVCLEIKAVARETLKSPILGFLVRDRLGQDLFGENTIPYTSINPIEISAGLTFKGLFEFSLPMLPNGEYAVMVSVADGDYYDNLQHHWLHDALIINVSSSKIRYGLVGIQVEKVQMKVTHD